MAIAGGCTSEGEVVVFHAASLSRSFDELAKRFAEHDRDTRVRLEASGSQVAVRKLSELGRRADLIAVADSRLLDEMLLPEHASWALDLMTTEIVIAHRDHSRYTDVIAPDTWPDILRREGVTLGCVDPNLAPIGYRMRLVWKLAEATGLTGLSADLERRCRPEHVMPHESELVALLFARSIDYAFLYRSTAEEHHLKLTPLAETINLGSTEVDYGGATVTVQLRHGAPVQTIRGAPILYGLSIPTRARHADAAVRFATFLTGAEARQTFERFGFRPLQPPRARGPGPLPPALLAAGIATAGQVHEQ